MSGTSIRQEEGVVLTIEFMVEVENYKTKLCRDGWTIEMEDRS